MIRSKEHYIRTLADGGEPAQQIWRQGTAPESIWYEIINESEELAIQVSFNKTLPASIIIYLARHYSWRVRANIAGKNRLPVELFDALSRDIQQPVRTSIAANAKTPLPILERLTNDSSEAVSTLAKRKFTARLSA